jgi:hypothetical protein
MKISINDQELVTVSALKKQVIQNEIPSEMLDDDLKRRMAYIIAHKYERCMERMRKEWEPKLKAKGVQQVPLDDDAFAQLVFSQPEYKDRSSRERAARPEFDSELPGVRAAIQNQLNSEISKLS